MKLSCGLDIQFEPFDYAYRALCIEYFPVEDSFGYAIYEYNPDVGIWLSIDGNVQAGEIIGWIPFPSLLEVPNGN